MTTPVEDKDVPGDRKREREREREEDNWIVTKCAHLPLCLRESLQASAFEYEL